MNRLFMVAAACLLASGCANNKMLGGRGCGQACHITRSQMAPRPNITRTACRTSNCGSRRGLLGGLLGGRNQGGREMCQGCGGRGCGLCARAAAAVNPHAGGYPEQPSYNPGRAAKWRIHTTQYAAHATFCKAIRRHWDRIESRV